MNGVRAACLLRAHVEDDKWLVHKGSFVEGQLATNPLHQKDLLCKDIVAVTRGAPFRVVKEALV